MLSALFLPLLAAIPYVSAHGFIGQVAIDGKWYAGNVPGNYKGPSPIRLVDDIGPVKGSSNVDLACGLSAQKAEMVVPANPGSAVSFQWSGGAGQKWPHNTGPLMTYMASCGSTTCDQFDASGAKWFKIDQVAKNNGSSDWVQLDIMSGDAFTVMLPQNLSPGGYLIRHEIIALHLAQSMGGAEFYPSCTQVQVGGSGNGTPQSTISFPGAYSDSDPGIYDPNVYDPGSAYVFPGGPLSNLASSGASTVPGATGSASFPSGTAVTPSSPTQSSASPLPSATNADPSGSTSGNSQQHCGLQRRSMSTASVNRPRHYSRIMRRLLQHSSFSA